ncbi:MAG: hypothetical protein HQK76_13095 [Desulfobacterales bacterium]|nr:hypothetical protein [Desulfobacterales bacterium]
MFKTIVTIILTIVVMLFAIQNFDHVPLYIFTGKAINVRLIFIIAIAWIGGYLNRLFIGIAKEERLKRDLQLLKKRQSKSIKKVAEFNSEFDEEM